MGLAPAKFHRGWSKAQGAHCIGEEAEKSRINIRVQGHTTGKERQFLSSELLA